MKKKIFFTLICVIVFGVLKIIAQTGHRNVPKAVGDPWTQGGNLIGANQIFGSQDGFGVTFQTSNMDRGTLTSDGRWGFGTISPNAITLVHINSAAGQHGLRVDINGVRKFLVSDLGGVSVGGNAVPPAGGLFVSGMAGIGTSAPQVKLHVIGGNDVGLAGGGYIVAGLQSGANIGIDNNEIMARNNGAASVLFLNNDGGDLNVSNGALVVAGATNNVGIGVAAPTSKLQVAGDLEFNGAGSGIIFDNAQTIRDGAGDDIECHGDFVPDNDDTHSVGTIANSWLEMHAGNYLASPPGPQGNIQDLSYGVNEIMKLRPISFSWQHDPDGKNLGLIAKEVQPVLPEAVRDWQYSADEKTGKLSKVAASKLALEYDAFIPILIKGMQEQQHIIQEQQQEISAFKDRLAKLEAALNKISSVSNSDVNTNLMSKEISGASLQQNEPNPFNQITTIRYKIPAGVNAQIMVYGAAGSLVKNLRATESGQVKINAYELKAGTYTYSLMIDGKLAATKKMVLIK